MHRAQMGKRTVRSHKRSSGRQRHRTRNAKKSGGAPRPEAWIGKLWDIDERLRSILEDAYKIEDTNSEIGDLRFHSFPEETRRALSNSYNTIEDKVREIKAACDDGANAIEAALSVLSALAR